MGRKMDRDENLRLVQDYLAQSLVILDDVGETLAAAKLQDVIDTIADLPLLERPGKKLFGKWQDHKTG